LRQPELEALLAEHRQYGGLSAVQVSSGFLRNATYELPAKR
jgi:sigma-E factor negative regulatory protein RseA